MTGVRGARAALLTDLADLVAGAGRVTVAFSGGRDSTLVLAAAVRAAREQGRPDPVPVTQVWSRQPALDESHWQELVVRELRLTDWQRVEMDDDSELLGAPSRTGLHEHGLVWPTGVHAKARLWAAARGSHLLTGEGGDQVFGPTRVRALHHWRRGLHYPRAWARQLGRGAVPAQRPWLRAGFTRDVVRAQRRHAATQPLRARMAIPWVARDRAVVTGLAALDAHAARHDVTLHHPLLSPAFVASLSRDAGLLGWPDRTRAMAAVAGDLVPHAVLHRTDKVEFSSTVWGRQTRAWLADRWDGTSGVDPELVDAGALRRAWAEQRPHPGTALLAQAAWLAQEGRDGAPR